MKLALLAATAAFIMPVAASAQLADGSFETQGAASTGPGGYCYFLGNYASACANGAWTGGGTTSGIQSETNTPWPGTPTPAGGYYAFIQSGYGAAGSISQSLTLTGGNYQLHWLDAGRLNSRGNQVYNVLVDGMAIGAGMTSSSQPFAQRVSNPFALTAGTHTLTFQALNSGGDNAAFIDAVTLSAVPEPASWALMIGGFGVMGLALRRRTRATAAFA